MSRRRLIRPETPRMLAIARKLRQPLSPIERLLWARLRNGRLAGMKFRRQVPIGQHVVDFYCHEQRMVVELDGWTHVLTWEKDQHRKRDLESRGLKVVTFGNRDVVRKMQGVLQAILAHAAAAPLALTPDPSPVRSATERERGDRAVGETGPRSV